MDAIVIFGASKNGLRVKRDLESKGLHVKCFCDNNSQKIGNKLDGTDILSFEKVMEKYGEALKNIGGGVIIAVNEPDGVMLQIRESTFHIMCYGLSYEYLHGDRRENFLKQDSIYAIDVNKPRLEYYEYHISYHCNLKCKGCGHYSNAAPEEYGDLEKYKKDVARLKELYAGVKRIRLMGGEPLLNPHLADFCNISRQAFPDANIRVVTNGLLIPSISIELLQVMKETCVGFDVTQYPPTSRMKEKIILKCLENGIDCTKSEPVTQFFSITNPAGDSDPQKEFEMCVSRGCHFLENGRMSVCAVPILNKKYKTMIDERMKVCEEDIINIYEEDLDGFKLNQLLSQPVESCRFCDNTHKQWFAWCGNFTNFLC